MTVRNNLTILMSATLIWSQSIRFQSNSDCLANFPNLSNLKILNTRQSRATLASLSQLWFESCEKIRSIIEKGIDDMKSIANEVPTQCLAIYFWSTTRILVFSSLQSVMKPNEVSIRKITSITTSSTLIANKSSLTNAMR